MNPIRPATEADFDRIAEMGAGFWEQTQYARAVPYDPDSIRRWCEIMSVSGLLLVAQVGDRVVGAVGALSAPALGNMKYLMASEMFWWLEPEHRNNGLGMALLIGIEAAAKAAGVSLFSMVALNSVDPEKAAQMYLQAGYTMTEWNFTKAL